MEKNINPETKSKKIFDDGLGPTGTFFLIILFFMFSNKIIDIFWDIAKSLLYLILILFSLNLINPTLSIKLRDIIMDLINIDSENNFIKDVLSKIFNYVKPYVQESVNKITENKVKSETSTVSTTELPKKDLKIIENRDLQSKTETNNRRMIQ